MSDHYPVQGFRQLATIVSQSDELGSGVSQLLKMEAARLRSEHLTQIRERTGRLPIQLSVPIVLFFLPALLALLIGPALVSLVHMLFAPSP
jgi:tight adherence protein C